MKRLLFFAILALSTWAQLSAQFLNQKITTAGGISIDHAYLINDIISVKEHGFLVVQSMAEEDHSEIELEIFDLSRTMTNRNNLIIPHAQGELRLQGYKEWHNTFLLFISLYQEELRTNELFVYQYSLPDLKLIQEKKLDEAYNLPHNRLPVFFNSSPDDSKLAFTSWSYSLPEDPGNINCKIFDAQLNLVREERYLLPYQNQDFIVEQNLVDNLGNVYVIGKNHNLSPELSYEMMVGAEGQKFIIAFLQEPELFELDLKKHRFNQIVFKINRQERLVGLGMYKKGSRMSYAGTGLFELDPIEKTLKMTTEELTKEDFMAALGEEQFNYATSKSYFRKARVKDVIVKRNAYYIVGERIKYEVDVERNSGYLGQSARSLNYDFNVDHTLLDMFVIKLDTKGKFIWMKRIPKMQEIQDNNYPYFSFTVIEREGDLLLFYNDHKDNFELKNKQKLKPADIRHAVPMLAKVNCRTGKIVKRKLTSLFGDQSIIRPYFCKTLDEDKVFMYGQSRKHNLETYRMKIAKLGG